MRPVTAPAPSPSGSRRNLLPKLKGGKGGSSRSLAGSKSAPALTVTSGPIGLPEARSLSKVQIPFVQRRQPVQEGWLRLLGMQRSGTSFEITSSNARTAFERRKVEIVAAMQIQRAWRGWLGRALIRAYNFNPNILKILRRQAWKARLHIRSVQRVKHAKVLRTFLGACPSKFVAVVRSFRQLVMRGQTYLVKFRQCHDARLLVLERKWKRVFFQYQKFLRRESLALLEEAAAVEPIKPDPNVSPMVAKIKAKKKAQEMSTGALAKQLESKLSKLSTVVAGAQKLIIEHQNDRPATADGSGGGDASSITVYKKPSACNKYVPPAIRRRILREFLECERHAFRKRAARWVQAQREAPRFNHDHVRKMLAGQFVDLKPLKQRVYWPTFTLFSQVATDEVMMELIREGHAEAVQKEDETNNQKRVTLNVARFEEGAAGVDDSERKRSIKRRSVTLDMRDAALQEEFDAAAETSGQRKRSTSTPEVNSPKIIGKRGWGREQLPPVDESEGKGGGASPSASPRAWEEAL